MEQSHSNNQLSDDERRRRKEELRRQAQERLANVGRAAAAAAPLSSVTGSPSANESARVSNTPSFPGNGDVSEPAFKAPESDPAPQEPVRAEPVTEESVSQETLSQSAPGQQENTTSQSTDYGMAGGAFISADELERDGFNTASSAPDSHEISSYVVPPKNAGKTPSAIAVLSLLIAGGAVLASAYLFNQLEKTQMQISALTTLLDQKAQQIDGLNQKLSNTDETADLSLDALKVVLRDQEEAIDDMGTRIAENTNRIRSFPNMDSLAQDQRDFVKLAYDLKVKVEILEEKMDVLMPESAARAGLPQLRKEFSQLKQAVTEVTQTYGYKEIQDMKLQLEDINIRLDRMQNAVGS